MHHAFQGYVLCLVVNLAIYPMSAVSSPGAGSSGSKVVQLSKASESKSKPKRPKIGWLRYNEDWSVLKETGKNGWFEGKSGWFDPIKYIPLNEEGDVYASFGGQIRQRVEVWDSFAFSDANDDTFLLSRYQLHGDLHLGKNARIFVEGIFSHIPDTRDLPGGTRAALDANEGDLLNAFFDLRFDVGEVDTTLRIGRQQFLFGKQRLISPLPWANNYRHWDGFSGILKYEDWTLTPFFAWFTPFDKFAFDDVAGTDDTGNGTSKIYGAYLTKKGLGHLYYIGRTASPSVDDSSHTIGLFRSAKIGDTGFDYEIEGAIQILNNNADDFAYMLGGHIGYAFREVETKPWVYTGIEMGSASYDQLFPLGHGFFGYADVLGRGNSIDWKTGVKFTPFKKLTVKIDHHMFFREDTDTATTNAGGGLFRGTGSDQAHIGNELDLTVKYPLAWIPNTSLMLGYSHVFAGPYVDDTGSADDIDFFYTQLLFRF